MHHKLFRISLILEAILLIALVVLYNYFAFTEINLEIKLLLKVFPLLSLMLIVILYFQIYRLTIYSLGILASLLFCVIGDFFVGLYQKETIFVSNEQSVYFILGGGFFLFARLLLCVVFIVKPYRNFSLIKFPYKKTFICHIIFVFPFIILGILELIYDQTLVSVSIFLYSFFGFGFTLSYSFLRIGQLSNNNSDSEIEIEESKISSLVAFIGILLFNFSDIILILSLINIIPEFFIIISDNIYWLAMYLLTASIVRSSNELIEKGFEYLIVENPDI